MVAHVAANPFGRQWEATAAAVLEAVRRVGCSGHYVLGPEVAAFERALASASGTAHAVGCASGLDAIELALRGLGIRPGEAVLTTPLSAFATTLAIVRAGGVPVFTDVDALGHLDVELAERALDRERDVRFVVPVHLYGHALDLDAWDRLRSRRSLLLIEDAAQAVLGTRRGRAVGSVGDATILSFYPTKNLGALGDGGALLTPSPALADSSRSLRDYGQSAKYVHDRLGMNSRLDELHAAVLRDAYLPRLAEWTVRRRALAARYRDGLHHPLVRILAPASHEDSVWHLFPSCVPADRREGLLMHLRAHGVQAGVHYPALIPDQPAMRGIGRTLGSLDRAREIAAGEVSLPIHPFLHDEEIDHVIEVVNRWKP